MVAGSVFYNYRSDFFIRNIGRCKVHVGGMRVEGKSSILVSWYNKE